ncbi:uncharacterized protein FIBRA_01162 [Fibroporia radiculosa]|uniref:Uncharacterized protein n=1 Tax=Fibroporia radiculosa TaxID=599839 RepID=J4HSV3_9APHY|nr:uncharacterized protein FIBRA_01162 [Fibroporia radiculosa]CCL99147.1 predicted protein [Fibroporia radiculosa]
MSSGTSKHASASKLGDLLAQVGLNEPNQWEEIEDTAKHLADDLRIKDVDQQTALGKTLLPQTLNSLLKVAINGAAVPDSACKPAIYEILRVAANLCMDHGKYTLSLYYENRSYLLDAGFPQTVVSLLEGYAEGVQSNHYDPLPLSIADLKVVKTCIGFLLNASIGYEPVKTRLISLEAAITILKLSMTVYPPGSWLVAQHPDDVVTPESDKHAIESWTLRSGLSPWAWRAISELRDDEEDNQQVRSLFGPDALPFLTRPLRAFVPPYLPPSTSFVAPSLRHTFALADFESLEEVCGLLESLCLDLEDVRLSLARGLTFPDGEHDGVTCLSSMLTFIDNGDYPPHWATESAGERASMEKAFDICKAAIVKAVVEVAGEEKNADTLWDDSEPQKPGGEFVNTMVQWIRKHKLIKETNRDDLIICATLSLGNLARRGTLHHVRNAHATALIRPPIALGPDLATLLEPDTDIKVKHGLVGLLKHLAQSQSNRAALGEAGIIQRLASSQVWGDKADMAEMVQVSAIGVAKHMCNGNVENAIALVSPPSDCSLGSPLNQILALVRRSDSIAVKSEGTRVLVNIVKALWASDPAAGTDKTERREAAVRLIVNTNCASALAQLVGRSKKYPVLINEGVVALSLMSTHSSGGTLVLDAILNPLPSEVVRSSQSQPVSAVPTEGSPVVGPRSALDMLVFVLGNAESMPMEVRANVCALLGQLCRKGVVAKDRTEDLARMKEATRELIEELGNEIDGKPSPLSVSAKRALEAWD